ncbi:CLUMA_CG003032, isoform A [Clunio marinus]|uniref:CLUMA_CG003032, isoform A n=1 Tax=Clunio marinus TaxID=568069 RepID=A0A1J1HSV1_9DIPT|nr:CLUMA_CG003032, isoform A [Clunio marinus]
MEVIPTDIDLINCCRLCLSNRVKLISIFEENILNLISKHLPYIKISQGDTFPKNICNSCNVVLKQFEGLYNFSIENDKKLRKLSLENSREEAKQIEDDLADAVNEIGLMLSDGNNLRSNFVAIREDDESDKSLEIPGSLETDLAKDIDRILAMTQLDDIPGPNQIYSCDFCQPQPPIATLSELNEHLKSAHIDLVFHCETCDNFIDRNSLIQHMMGHLKERETLNENRVEEANENDDDRQHDEEEGEEGEASEEKSVKVEKECIKAGKTEKPEKERNHQMKKASGSNVKFLKKCHHCPKLFSNRSGRLYHQEQVHFERRRFHCDQCKSSFGSKQTLMNHILNKHSNNERTFICDFPSCEKSYKTKSALYNHRIYHSDDPKWHCNYCSKKFHFPFLLQQHESTHLGKKSGKSYDCDVCKKSFNTRNKLTKHRGIHDANQYACTREGCTFKGNLKRYLIAHIKRMHS